MQITKQDWLNSNHVFTDAAQQKLNAIALPQVASAARQARPDATSNSWTFQWQEIAFTAQVDDLGMVTISLPEEEL